LPRPEGLPRAWRRFQIGCRPHLPIANRNSSYFSFFSTRFNESDRLLFVSSSSSPLAGRLATPTIAHPFPLSNFCRAGYWATFNFRLHFGQTVPESGHEETEKEAASRTHHADALRHAGHHCRDKQADKGSRHEEAEVNSAASF
jgi:hypothetical protein